MINVAAALMVFYKAENQKQLLDYLQIGFGNSSSSFVEDWALLKVVVILPVLILVYEFLLFYKREDNKEAYLGILEKHWVHQAVFYLVVGLLSLYFSNVASQAVFYMQY